METLFPTRNPHKVDIIPSIGCNGRDFMEERWIGLSKSLFVVFRISPGCRLMNNRKKVPTRVKLKRFIPINLNEGIITTDGRRNYLA
jgi:hypothetical protein